MGLVHTNERKRNVGEHVRYFGLHHFWTNEEHVQLLLLNVSLDNEFLVELDGGGVGGASKTGRQVLHVVETQRDSRTQHHPQRLLPYALH